MRDVWEILDLSDEERKSLRYILLYIVHENPTLYNYFFSLGNIKRFLSTAEPYLL